ncbi:endo alpha-1,4 polygalactosaminidase [Actinomadura roseirufa]|uniref:endo alpha-1,4 polygalactosaminidase n=1 Tax=Actinomadura roseirufa TaxID=2094049 RepID=UPI00104135A7|nr:endo alpha-1,4 polygalactosaminidase [Actinomadura roseirufa]
MLKVGSVLGAAFVLAGTTLAAGCSSSSDARSSSGVSSGSPSASRAGSSSSSDSSAGKTAGSSAGKSAGPAKGAAAPGTSATKARWKPVVGSRWQYQLSPTQAYAATGGVNVGVCAKPFTGGACVRPEVYDIDLYSGTGATGTLNTAAVRAIHARGAKAICYMDAGSVEKDRPEYQEFVKWNNAHGRSLIGKAYPGFPDENYANINNDRGQRDYLLKVQEARVRKCVQAGFDGVEFDVVNSYEDGEKVTGWKISAATQLTYNKALAALAHKYNLAVGLKNDLSQVPALVSSFDFAINEECWENNECDVLKAFIRAGKPVFGVEYRPSGGPGHALGFCRPAASSAWRFSTIKKGEDYALHDTPYTPCR